MNHEPLTLRIRRGVAHFFGMRTKEEIAEQHERDSQRALSVKHGLDSATRKLRDTRRHLSKQPSFSEIPL